MVFLHFHVLEHNATSAVVLIGGPGLTDGLERERVEAWNAGVTRRAV